MNQPDSPEFTEILNRLPRWHLLTPGVDVWREGDQFYDWAEYDDWFDCLNDMVGSITGQAVTTCESEEGDAAIGRRPIPEHVRRSEAWWALYNQLATVAPIPRFDQAHSQFIVTLYADHSGDDNPSAVLDVEEESQFNGLRGFNGSSKAYAALKVLGGEQEIIKNLQEGPGAYMRWVLE